jgi:hypothetical protein
LMAKRSKDPAEINRIRATIFDKLNRRGKWGPAHTSKENALKGIASHDIGAAKDILDEAIKDGFLNLKPTSYGGEVSLNFERRAEILAIIAGLLEE